LPSDVQFLSIDDVAVGSDKKTISTWPGAASAEKETSKYS